MSDNEQDEIITEFLVEAHENLDVLDRELLALEKNPHTPELLASVFRRVHTVKGACGFLGFSKLETVAHASENLLSKVREEELELTPTIITALLGVADTMRNILGGIEANGKEGDEDHSATVEIINRLQRPGAAAAPAAAEPAPLAVAPTAPPPRPAPASAPAAAPAPAPLVRGPDHPSDHPTAVEPPAAERAHTLSDSYLRVDVGLLDKLMNLVGELVLARNQILQFSAASDDATLRRRRRSA